MNEFELKYLKNDEGNYIIKETNIDEDENQYLITTGIYSENLIISKEFFNKKLEHKLDDIVKSIEEKVMLQNKIYKEDFLFEKFVATVTPEEEFNPLFQIFTEKEATEYTKNSSKVRINISFEIGFKVKPHLWFKVLLNLFKKTKE